MKTLKEIRAKMEGELTPLAVVVKQESKCDYQTIFVILENCYSTMGVSLLRYFKLGGISWECSIDFQGYWADAVRLLGSNFNDQMQDIAEKDNE